MGNTCTEMDGEDKLSKLNELQTFLKKSTIDLILCSRNCLTLKLEILFQVPFYILLEDQSNFKVDVAHHEAAKMRYTRHTYIHLCYFVSMFYEFSISCVVKPLLWKNTRSNFC